MIILRVRTQLHKAHTHTQGEKKTSKKKKDSKSIKQWKDRKKLVLINLQLIFINED